MLRDESALRLKGFYFWGKGLFRFLENRLGPLEHSLLVV
jgi:hypothetical protein